MIKALRPFIVGSFHVLEMPSVFLSFRFPKRLPLSCLKGLDEMSFLVRLATF